MIDFENARQKVLENISPIGLERVYVLESCGRVLAEDIRSPWDMPGLDNSAMDGFAINYEDCKEAPVTLPISGYQPAGRKGMPDSAKGNAYKINTGGALPKGCDTVVPVEMTEVTDGYVTITSVVVKGAHVRKKGEDVKAGTIVLREGDIVRPPEVSMIASCNRVFISVFRRPQVAVLSTGDELIEVGEPFSPEKIINSNSLSIASAVLECGANPNLQGIARDDENILRERISEGLKSDVLITTAGISMGDRDLVKGILEELGVKMVFEKARIKPGKPIAFGMKKGTPVFALPGNPVSAMITFEEFVRPALLKMMGYPSYLKMPVKARLLEPIKKKVGRVEFLRVRVELKGGEYIIRSSGEQQSGILRTLVGANGLAILPEERTSFETDESVMVHLLYENLFRQAL